MVWNSWFNKKEEKSKVGSSSLFDLYSYRSVDVNNFLNVDSDNEFLNERFEELTEWISASLKQEQRINRGEILEFLVKMRNASKEIISLHSNQIEIINEEIKILKKLIRFYDEIYKKREEKLTKLEHLLIKEEIAKNNNFLIVIILISSLFTIFFSFLLSIKIRKKREEG